MNSEKAKMLAGELYRADDAQLVADRQRAHALCRELNLLALDAAAERDRLLAQLFGRAVKASITPPFFCDYGYNIELGDNVYFNFNCVILDVARVRIGSDALFGSGVQIYAASHPMLASQRKSGLELGKPVVIGDAVWVGGAAIVCPGVTIGARSVIGAGSVVTRDIPADVFAAGNPCRTIRTV